MITYEAELNSKSTEQIGDIKALIKCLPYEVLSKMLKSNRVSANTHKKLVLEFNLRDTLNESEPKDYIYT